MVAGKLSEERVVDLRRFLVDKGIRQEAEEVRHLARFLAAFPDATLREIYIAGFGLILHLMFADDIDQAKAALFGEARLTQIGDGHLG